MNLSDFLVLKSGVPQGSILGPLLFVVYINDIANVKLNGVISLYADDTAIFNKDKNCDLLIDKTNEDISKIVKFFKVNKLVINDKKTQLMIFTSPKKNVPMFNKNFIINESILNPSDSVKYLGLFFDPHLKWEFHINKICKLIAPVVGILFRLKYVIPESALLNIYYSLINSRLSYLNVIWCSGYKTSLNTIATLQNKATKNIFRLPLRFSTQTLYENYPIKSLDYLFKLNTILFIRKNLQNNIHSKIQFNKTESNYDTRNKNKISLKTINNNYGKFNITFNGSKLYNKIPDGITKIQNFNSFKKLSKIWLQNNIN